MTSHKAYYARSDTNTVVLLIPPLVGVYYLQR